MDLIISFLLVGIVVMLLHGVFQSNSEPEYMLVPIQRPQQSRGCLPIVVGLLVGMFVLMLLQAD